MQISAKWAPPRRYRTLEITGLVVVSDEQFATFKGRLQHIDVHLACGLCLRADVLLHHRVGREIIREFLEFDRTDFTGQVEALRYPLERTDFQLRYQGDFGFQIECPLGYRSGTISPIDLFGTVAGVVLWEGTVEASLRSSGVSSVRDEQPQNVCWSPKELRRQLSRICC